jgi:hypothetical protein
MQHFFGLLTAFLFLHFSAISQEKPISVPVNPDRGTLSVVISKKYLNIPISNAAERSFMHFDYRDHNPGRHRRRCCLVHLAMSAGLDGEAMKDLNELNNLNKEIKFCYEENHYFSAGHRNGCNA